MEKNCINKLLKILKEQYMPFLEKEHYNIKKAGQFGKREIFRNYIHIQKMKKYIKELEEILKEQEVMKK